MSLGRGKGEALASSGGDDQQQQIPAGVTKPGRDGCPNKNQFWQKTTTSPPSSRDDRAGERDKDYGEDPGPDAEHHESNDVAVGPESARAKPKDAAEEEEGAAPNTVSRILKICK